MTARDSIAVPVVRITSRLIAAATSSGGTFDDTSASNRVLAVVLALVLLGVALLAYTIWFWRSTKPESSALAPLELIGTRKFRKADDERRKRALATVRPVDPDQSAVDRPIPELVDLAALASRDLPSLADLADFPAFTELEPKDPPLAPADAGDPPVAPVEAEDPSFAGTEPVDPPLAATEPAAAAPPDGGEPAPPESVTRSGSDEPAASTS